MPHFWFGRTLLNEIITFLTASSWGTNLERYLLFFFSPLRNKTIAKLMAVPHRRLPSSKIIKRGWGGGDFVLVWSHCNIAQRNRTVSRIFSEVIDIAVLLNCLVLLVIAQWCWWMSVGCNSFRLQNENQTTIYTAVNSSWSKSCSRDFISVESLHFRPDLKLAFDRI